MSTWPSCTGWCHAQGRSTCGLSVCPSFSPPGSFQQQPTAVALDPTPTLMQIAAALERIARALERIVAAPPRGEGEQTK